MNVEELREYCLSLGDVTEKMPFGRFAARYDSILVFYVEGHMFCLFDIDDFSSVNVRSTPGEMDELRARYDSVGTPVNRAMCYWVEIQTGGDVADAVIYSLVRRAYEIVRDRYRKKR